MGTDKADLTLGGQTLLERVLELPDALSDDLLVVTRHVERYAHLPARVIHDEPGPPGSLLGIYSGVKAAQHDLALVVACDMPFLSQHLLRHMASLAPGYDVVAPRLGGYAEPLHAIYRKTCLAPMRALLDGGERRIVSFFPQVQVRYVGEPELERFDPQRWSFVNVNTPEDWRQAQDLFAAAQGRPER
ncbi:MAG: molybdenum cofactor guanylyltransferase [Chloroflexi bacterium]|nr:molybdenum cofactor guanylyltransferase [Chloroflexota bacterium]